MNRVMLIGNVGTVPEIKYYESDQCVATFRFATSEKGYTLPNGTKVPDRTDWHNIVCYRRLAKVVEKYVGKGDKLYLDGRLQYRQYDDKRGIQRTVSEIILENMELLTLRHNSPSAEQQSTANTPQPTDNSKETNEEQEKVLPF